MRPRRGPRKAPADAVTTGNDGKLLAVSGMAIAEDEVSDPEFKINAKAIHIDRRVEMYQWEEDQETRAKKKVGGGET